jgi:hypothetical protein
MNMRALVSSVRVSKQGAHEVLKVWSRGGYAGELVVNEGDGGQIASSLVSVDEDGATVNYWVRRNEDGSQTYVAGAP